MADDVDLYEDLLPSPSATSLLSEVETETLLASSPLKTKYDKLQLHNHGVSHVSSSSDSKVKGTFPEVASEEDIESFSIDLYSDLITAEATSRQQHLSELSERCQELESKTATLGDEADSLKIELATVKKENLILRRNISSLYKTAKAEIDRKNADIAQLRQRLDDLVFRRARKLEPEKLHNGWKATYSRISQEASAVSGNQQETKMVTCRTDAEVSRKGPSRDQGSPVTLKKSDIESSNLSQGKHGVERVQSITPSKAKKPRLLQGESDHKERSISCASLHSRKVLKKQKDNINHKKTGSATSEHNCKTPLSQVKTDDRKVSIVESTDAPSQGHRERDGNKASDPKDRHDKPGKLREKRIKSAVTLPEKNSPEKARMKYERDLSHDLSLKHLGKWPKGSEDSRNRHHNMQTKNDVVFRYQRSVYHKVQVKDDVISRYQRPVDRKVQMKNDVVSKYRRMADHRTRVKNEVIPKHREIIDHKTKPKGDAKSQLERLSDHKTRDKGDEQSRRPLENPCHTAAKDSSRHQDYKHRRTKDKKPIQAPVHERLYSKSKLSNASSDINKGRDTHPTTDTVIKKPVEPSDLLVGNRLPKVPSWGEVSISSPEGAKPQMVISELGSVQYEADGDSGQLVKNLDSQAEPKLAITVITKTAESRRLLSYLGVKA